MRIPRPNLSRPMIPGFSSLDLLIGFGTLMGTIGFGMVALPLAPLFLMIVCYFLANLAWRAT